MRVVWLRRLWPLRLRGALFALGSGAALQLWGRAHADLIALTIGMTGIVLLLGSGLAVAVAALTWSAVTRRGRTTLARLEAGEASPTGFCMPRHRLLPLVELSWSWQRPTDVRSEVRRTAGRLRESATPLHRFGVQQITRRFSVRDVLGLWCLRWNAQENVRVHALPARGRLTRVRWPELLCGGDGLADPMGQPRHILWKSFARARRLDVRVPERALAPARTSLVYLCTGTHDEPAAAAARVTLESGALGARWRFAADGESATDRLGAALEAIARSRARREHPGLEDFLARSRERSAACIVFAGARDTHWIEAVRRAAERRPGAVFVVAAIDLEPDEPDLRHRVAALASQLGSVPLAGVDRRSGSCVIHSTPLGRVA
jgi:hypothetical protein